MSKTTWIRGGCVAAAIFMAAVLFVGAKGIGKLNSVPMIVHKAEHFLYYGGMMALLAFGVGRRRLWIALLVVLLVGALDEWHQFYVPGRNGSAYDWMVDVFGVVVAVYVYYRATAGEPRREGKGKSEMPKSTP